jgi:hypothetical protein
MSELAEALGLGALSVRIASDELLSLVRSIGPEALSIQMRLAALRRFAASILILRYFLWLCSGMNMLRQICITTYGNWYIS